jgi:hypothetical protein
VEIKYFSDYVIKSKAVVTSAVKERRYESVFKRLRKGNGRRKKEKRRSRSGNLRAETNAIDNRKMNETPVLRGREKRQSLLV